MHLEYKALKEVAQDLSRLQQSHIASLDNELMPDLEQQLAARQQAFDQLMPLADQFIQGANQIKTQEMVTMVLTTKELIRDLVTENRILKAKIEKHQEDIRSRMKGVVKGRRVIGAYASPASLQNRPRAISLTN